VTCHVTADLTQAGRARNGSSREALERLRARLDVLVNNLGGTRIRRVDEVTDADWYASFELNLLSAIRNPPRRHLPGMRRARQAGRS